jgi:hypothetical protein
LKSRVIVLAACAALVTLVVVTAVAVAFGGLPSAPLAAVPSDSPSFSPSQSDTANPYSSVDRLASPSPPGSPSTSPSPSPTPSYPVAAHILVVMEENKGYAPTLGTCSADPYYCSLASRYASLTNWYGNAHGSLLDYLAFDSGSMQGQTTDCTTCGPFAGVDLGGQLSAVGIPWTAYM